MPEKKRTVVVLNVVFAITVLGFAMWMFLIAKWNCEFCKGTGTYPVSYTSPKIPYEPFTFNVPCEGCEGRGTVTWLGQRPLSRNVDFIEESIPSPAATPHD